MLSTAMEATEETDVPTPLFDAAALAPGGAWHHLVGPTARDAPRVVLASFNRLSKLDPPCWRTWMSILRRAPAAALVLFSHGEAHVEKRLRREAAAAGVRPSRLVFAPSVSKVRPLLLNNLALPYCMR